MIFETETATISDYEIERDKPMPSKNHAIVQANLLLAIQPRYANRYRVLPEISLDLPEKDRVPDLGIYPPMPFDSDDDEVKMTLPPLGVVEILSPMQDLTELKIKSKIYFRAGVKSYWLVLPSLRSVYVYSSPEDFSVFSRNDILKDPVLDIEVSLSEIFR